jgi:quinol monooxygenase YgiN
MAVVAIVELQSKPGRRGELVAALDRIVAEHGPGQAGFLGSRRYEVVGDPDRILEIADWESAEAREAHLREAAAAGVFAPLADLLAAPFRATVVRRLP